ncbi:hypothetical protein BJ138DRAFT_967879, partial [Hygrophoropsis aurantiaca]
LLVYRLSGIFSCIGAAIMTVVGLVASCLECIVSAIAGFFTGLVDCITGCLCCGSV